MEKSSHNVCMRGRGKKRGCLPSDVVGRCVSKDKRVEDWRDVASLEYSTSLASMSASNCLASLRRESHETDMIFNA